MAVSFLACEEEISTEYSSPSLSGNFIYTPIAGTKGEALEKEAYLPQWLITQHNNRVIQYISYPPTDLFNVTTATVLTFDSITWAISGIPKTVLANTDYTITATVASHI